MSESVVNPEDLVDEEPVEEVEEVEEETDESNLATWASITFLKNVEEAIRNLTPMPWRVLPDPVEEDMFYVAGPPETKVIAERMSEEDARNLVYLVNNLPEAIEHFEDLAQLWDALYSGEPDNRTRVDDYLEVINRYQIHIAQLMGTASVVPEVSKASDLTFMHIGSWISIPTMGDGQTTSYLPISMVADRGDFMEVTLHLDMKEYIVYLPKDMEVLVSISDSSPLRKESQTQDESTSGEETVEEITEE